MTVWVVHSSNWIDPRDGQLKPKFDFGPAEKFGRLEFVLSPTASPFRTEEMVREIQEKLSSIEPEDYILLSGSPVFIGLVVAIAADYLDGDVNLLQWSGAKKEYIPVRVKGLFPV